jgi:hypothetical protein
VAETVSDAMQAGVIRKDDKFEIAMDLWGLVHGYVALRRRPLPNSKSAVTAPTSPLHHTDSKSVSSHTVIPPSAPVIAELQGD